MSTKNSNDTIGNRTRDLPTCTALPQTTAPPRSPLFIVGVHKFSKNPGTISEIKALEGGHEPTFHTENPKVLGVKYLVATATWQSEFGHP